MSTTDTTGLPDYAPVPRSALGPALNEQGYYVGRVERNLYWITDGSYQCAFLTTSDGVVLLDAPPTIGHNIQRAVDEIASANGVSNKVNYLVYSHHHADHSPDNIIIHLPDHDALMLIDIVNPGWAPVFLANLTEDIPGYLEAPAKALAYSWKHFIAGHLGRLGTREDIALHQQYMADIAESSRKALDTVDLTRYFVKYGDNPWAAFKGGLEEWVATAAAPVIEKYTGVLAAADVFTESTTFQVMQSIRLDLGYGSWVHP